MSTKGGSRLRDLRNTSLLGGLGAKVHNLRVHNLLGPSRKPVVADVNVALLDEVAAPGCSDDDVRKAVGRACQGQSLLHAAMLRGDMPVVERLLAFEDANRRDDMRWTSLHWACSFCDNPEVLLALLKRPGVDLDAADDKGVTALMLAVDASREGSVRELLDAGANPDLRAVSGTCAMLIAAYHGGYRMAELLFRAGANVDVAGEDGLSPLMIAVKQDDMDMVVFLVKMGAMVEYSTKLGTARSLASSAVVRQFLSDSAFYQTHHKDKKQQLYTRMVQTTRAAVSQPPLRTSCSNVVSGTSTPPVAPGNSLHGSSETMPPPSLRISELSPPGSPGPTRHGGSAMMPKTVYTSENYPLDLEFFTHPLLGRAQIGMSMCPGRNKSKPKHVWRRDLTADLKVIRDSGVEIMVVLVRQIELLEMGVMELFVRAEQLGVKTLHFPVQDKWVPESMTEVVQLVDKMVDFVRQSKKVTVFCNGGKGRTGMVVVATMVALGMSVDDAIVEVRRRRAGMIRNPAQIIYLRWFGTECELLSGLSSAYPFSTEARWRHEHHTDEEARDQLERELKSQRKLSKKSRDEKSAAFVTLTLIGARDIEADHLLFSLLAVSGPFPHQRHGWGLDSTGDRNRITFVAADTAHWHCLVGVAGLGGVATGTVVISGTGAAVGSCWRPVVDEERVVGHLEFAITVETKHH
jgi:ankyrin repeat protein/protein-tyrosine phosphatase